MGIFLVSITYRMMNCNPNSLDDRNNISVVCEVTDPKKSFQLLESYNNCCSSHEPHNCGMWKEVHYKAQSEQQQHIGIEIRIP